MADAKRIDGKAFAEGLRERVGAEVARIKSESDVTPGLAVVLVGEDPASSVYVRNKAKQTEEAGMKSIEHRMPMETNEADLLALIGELNGDASINGILVQLPLPDQIDEQKVLAAIDVEKDVDGFHVENVGRLWTGGDALVPCTPFGCILMLKVEYCRKADGGIVAGGKLHRQHLSFQTPRSGGTLSRSRYPGGRCWPARDDPGRLGKTGSSCYRRRHQPHRRARKR